MKQCIFRDLNVQIKVRVIYRITKIFQPFILMSLKFYALVSSIPSSNVRKQYHSAEINKKVLIYRVKYVKQITWISRLLLVIEKKNASIYAIRQHFFLSLTTAKTFSLIKPVSPCKYLLFTMIINEMKIVITKYNSCSNRWKRNIKSKIKVKLKE